MESRRGQANAARRTEFDALVGPLMKVLYNRALQLSHQSDAAADLVQETLLRAFRAFDQFQSGTNAKAWLLAILYSAFISRYRKQKREPNLVALEEANATLIAEDAAAPAALDPRLWASSEVHEALSQLPREFRTVLLMVDVDDLSYEEVAAALNCPVGTVRSRLSRARRMTYAALHNFARSRGFLRDDR